MTKHRFKVGDQIIGNTPIVNSTGRIIAIEGTFYKIFWTYSSPEESVQFKLFDYRIVDEFYNLAEKDNTSEKNG